MLLTIEKAQQRAALLLKEYKSPSPDLDARVLLCHVLDKPSSHLYTWPDKILCDEDIFAFDKLIERRKKGEPVAYIVGYRDFWSLRLCVEPSTLIPRPDTECLVEFALARLSFEDASLLDLGTGTGAIALAIAKERPDMAVLGVDFREDAVALSFRNAKDNGIENAHFVQSDWFKAVPAQRFDMIVSNPPYIDPNDPHLLEGDVRFEPQTALVAQECGLADIRHICNQGRAYLKPQGWLLIEHGFDQGKAVRSLFLDAKFDEVETLKDYSGLDRVTLGRAMH